METNPIKSISFEQTAFISADVLKVVEKQKKAIRELRRGLNQIQKYHRTFDMIEESKECLSKAAKIINNQTT